MIATVESISQGTIDDIFDTFVDARLRGEVLPLVFSEIIWGLIYANRRGELADMANNQELAEAIGWHIDNAKANAEALLNA
jgi:hypothetical protein